MQMQRVIKTQIRKEVLPKAADVVVVKQNRIKDELAGIIELGTFSDYLPLAQELIAKYGDATALAALIRLAFKTELDVKNYSEIRTFSIDKRGTARLFIALGKFDDMTPRGLVDFLKEHTKLTSSKIDDVKVMDSFSFATVPFEDAEEALHSLNALRGSGDKPLAEISKQERGGGGGGGRGDFAPSRGGRREGGGGGYRDRRSSEGGGGRKSYRGGNKGW
jgi:ATP-dependent RNA helicase DeaD